MSKKFRHFIFSILTVILVSLLVNNGFAQNKFWVNGAGSWNDINHWSETSGGSSGASIPTKLDKVTFDNNSFTANDQIVLINGSAVCKDFNWDVENYKSIFKSKSFLHKTITKAELQVYGSLLIDENIKNEFFGDIVLKSSSESILNSKSELNSDLIIDAEKGKYKLDNDLSTQGNILLKSGAFATSDNNLSANEFIGSGSEERKLDLGSSEVSVNKWNFAKTENIIFNGGESIIYFSEKLSKQNYKSGDIPLINFASKVPIGSKGLSLDLVTDSVSCFNGNDGSITINVIGGVTKPYRYELHKGVYKPGNPDFVIDPSFNDSETFSGRDADYYAVVVSEFGGFPFASGAINLYEPDELNVDTVLVNTGLTCWNGSDAELEAVASGGNTPYSYQWIKYNTGTTLWDVLTTNDPANKVLTGATQGWYKVFVTGALGCDGVKDIEIYFLDGFGYDAYIPDSIDITGVSSTNTCTGFSTGSITISATGEAPLSYAIVRPGIDSTTNATGIFNNLAAGTYRVYAIDVNDCFKRDADVDIIGLPNPTVGITPDPAAVCENTNLVMNGNPAGGSGTYVTHLWTGVGAAFLDNVNIVNPTFNSATDGSYALTYTVTDDNGCEGTDNITVTVNDNPTASIFPDPAEACEGENLVMNGNPAGGSGTYLTHLWTGVGAAFLDNVNIVNPMFNCPTDGSYALIYTVTDDNGCEGTDNITVKVTDSPTAFAGKDTTLCYDTPYQIQDADTLNSDGVTWEILTGNGSIIPADLTKIDPVYTPNASDGGAIVELVLHASGKGTCADATDTIRITYLSELLVAIGKSSPFLIDSTSTHINVYMKISLHRWLGDLALYLVSPLDSVVELKTSCLGILSPTDSLTARFYNDPMDSSTVYASTIIACNPDDGYYKFLGDWKKKLHGQDPSNGSWRVRIGDDRNISGSDGFLNEATITFSDTNSVNIFESVLYADSTINLAINESPGGGVQVFTDYALPITGLTTSCFGSCDAKAIATASGGQGPDYTYKWSYDRNFTLPLFDVNDTVNLCEGKVYVRVIDMHKCTADDSVMVGSPPEIVVDNQYVLDVACNGGTTGKIMLEFSGGSELLDYTIDSSMWYSSGDTIKNLPSKDYTLAIRDINTTCVKLIDITINEPTAMTITVDSTNIKCYGVPDGEINIAVSGGTSGYQYSIDSAVTWHANPFTSLDQDTFYIAVQDGAGCIQFSDTIEMLYPDTISIDAITVDPTTCAGGGVDGEINITASGGTGTLEYSIDGINFQASNIFTDLPIGDTSVYVTDNRCDTIKISVLVTGPTSPIINSITVTDVSCFGDNTGQMTVSVSGGTSVYKYYIDGVVNTPPDDYIFTDLIAGTYTISVIDDGGCISADSIREIKQPTELLINDFTIVDASECNLSGLIGSITVHAIGGVRDYKFSIDGDVPQDDSIFLITGTGVHTFAVTDDNGCEVAHDTSIQVINQLAVSFTSVMPKCNGYTDGSIKATPSGGTPPYNFEWSNGVITSGAITSTITSLNSGNYTVTITDSSQPDSCVLSDSKLLNEPLPITIAPDIRHKRCIYSSSRNDRPLSNSLGRIIVDVNGGTPFYSYKWTGPSITESNNYNDTIINLQPGLYNLTVTDFNNCERSLSATVVNDESFDILSFAVEFDDNSVCWNKSVHFTSTYLGNVDTIFLQKVNLSTFVANNGYYEVNDVSPFYARFEIEGNTMVEHIRATNKYCKEDTTNILVDYFPDFELDIAPGFDNSSLSDTIYLKGKNNGQLGATFADYIDVSSLTFAWTPEEAVSPANEQFTTVSPKESGIYNVLVTSTDNCVDSSEVYLEFIPAITPYTGFSPNGDGINDYWEINFIDKFPNNIVTIYNRWGVKVFEQEGYDNNDTSKSWDGNAKNGKELSSGTYYYVIILNEEGFSSISGSITIIR
ncbi:MAG: T9SS type B sorting domain-containing protein [Bacteroidales bacterium]|nr:T9SS type B sorting domain-containing protein [Bacteroidales bacterium]